MKYFLTTILAVGLISTQMMAQSKLKFGHIDSQELLESMPEKAEADKKIEEFARQLEKQLQTMTTEFEAKIKDYQDNQAVMSDLIKQTKAEEIQNLEKRIQTFQQNAQQSLAKKEAEVYQPIIDKAKAAIEKVAQANGYTYVFDTSSGALLFQPDSDDILPLVKKELGITETPK
ncbi:MAG: OmpH family outer membrane protein [Salibacteraceae bacterium]